MKLVVFLACTYPQYSDHLHGDESNTPQGSFSGNNAASANVPSSSGDLVLGVFGCETCTSVTFTAPAAQRWNHIAGGGNEIGAGAASAGASPNTTIAATLGSSDHWAMGGIAIKPVGGSGSSSGSKVLAAYRTSPHNQVKSRPRQEKGLRMQLSLVREPGVVWRSYYFAGASRIAMREDSDTGSEVYYILTDHLGSTSLTVYEDEQGQMQVKARQWYKPWGEVRQVTGQLPTDRTFQGQREPGWGLTHFGARWFDSNLGRFSQADTVIPGMNLSIAWDRYAGLFNNPLKYVDPSGHRPACEDGSNNCDEFHDWILEKRRFMKSPSQLSLSKNGLDFIKEQERFDPNPYNDGLDFRDPFYYDRTGNGTGNCTGGYGHKIHNGPCDGRPEEDRFIAISEVKALVILKDDIKAAEAVVRHNITAPLTQTQYDSLVSLCFNWDCAAHPTKINLINSGSYVAAGLHFLEGPIESNGEIMEGLIKRRYAEAVMFLTGYNVTLPTLEEYLADPLNVSLLP